MKAPITLLCSIFLISTAIFTSLLAQEKPAPHATIFPSPLPPSSAPAPAISSVPDQPQLLEDASTIMGHIGVANIALIHEAYPEATANIKSALEAVRELAEKTEMFNSHDPIKLANLSYFSDKGEQNFWLPILDNHFVVRSMDGGFLKSKKPDIQIMDAQVVYYRLALNIRNILERLEDAELALKKKEYKNAEFALQEAIRGTFVDKFLHEDPITLVLDHLMLSSELVRDKNFRSASRAITHAQIGLDALIKTLAAKSKAHDTATEIAQEIATMQKRIHKSSDMSSLKINEASFEEWTVQIRVLTSE